MNDEQKKLIENSLILPKILKEQKKIKVIDFFSKRPGGHYVLYLIMLLYERNIECTEETLLYYIPSNICSPSTLSNIIKDSIIENYIKKEPCKADHRSKTFIPSRYTIEQWNTWRSIMRTDTQITKDTSIANDK